MPKLFFNAPRLMAIFVAVASSLGLLNTMPAHGSSFKAIISDFPFPEFGKFNILSLMAFSIRSFLTRSPPILARAITRRLKIPSLSILFQRESQSLNGG